MIDKEAECGGWWVKMGSVLTTHPQPLSSPFFFSISLGATNTNPT